MRFLRMLTNSLLAGALGAAFLTIIVLQLNPSVPLLSATTWRLFVALGALLRRAPRGAVLPVDGRTRVHRPLRPVARLGERARPRVADGGDRRPAASVLMWLNVSGFAAALGETRSPAHDGGRGRDDGDRDRPARAGGGALFVRPARQPRRRRAAGDCGLRLARASGGGPRSGGAGARRSAAARTVSGAPCRCPARAS